MNDEIATILEDVQTRGSQGEMSLQADVTLPKRRGRKPKVKAKVATKTRTASAKKAAPKRQTKKAAAKSAVAEPKRRGRPKKQAAQPSPERKVTKLAATKCSKVRFVARGMTLFLRDGRTLTTPLKLVDKRLPKLKPRERKDVEVVSKGSRLVWKSADINVDIADVMRFI